MYWGSIVDAAIASSSVAEALPWYSLTAFRDKRIGRRLARIQRRQLLDLPAVDLDLAGDDPCAALGDQPHCERVEPMLGGKDARRQAPLVVIRVHRYHGLGDDRPGVDFGTHKMHRTTGKAHASSQRLALRMKPGERRQQRGMDIDHTIAPSFDKAGIEDAHEAGEANQLDLALAKPRIGFGGKTAAITVRNHRRGMPAAAARAKPAASARLLTTM